MFSPEPGSKYMGEVALWEAVLPGGSGRAPGATTHSSGALL